jgi:hypothetical protein
MANKVRLREVGFWGIYRDGELYAVAASRWLATERMRTMRPGSKHEWRVARVRVVPVRT